MNADSTVLNSEVVSVLTAEFLTPAEVAPLLKVSRWMLADWRLKRQGPPFMLMRSGVVVYPIDALRRYLRARPQKDCREGLGWREAQWSRPAVGQELERRRNHGEAS